MIDMPPEIQALLTPVAYAFGSPNVAVRSQLQQLTREFPAKAKDRDFALACMASLWLYHDFLDESHSISQDLDTAEGSYWHALMHRREGDFSNAKYWFRRVGEHAVFPALADAAREFGLKLRSERWNPFDFVDLCEKHTGTGTPDEMLLRRVQQKEWELLFDWCYQRAFGID
jgi:hypothetical protein